MKLKINYRRETKKTNSEKNNLPDKKPVYNTPHRNQFWVRKT
jgi:hypothetical protein